MSMVLSGRKDTLAGDFNVQDNNTRHFRVTQTAASGRLGLKPSLLASKVEAFSQALGSRVKGVRSWGVGGAEEWACRILLLEKV